MPVPNSSHRELWWCDWRDGDEPTYGPVQQFKVTDEMVERAYEARMQRLRDRGWSETNLATLSPDTVRAGLRADLAAALRPASSTTSPEATHG